MTLYAVTFYCLFVSTGQAEEEEEREQGQLSSRRWGVVCFTRSFRNQVCFLYCAHTNHKHGVFLLFSIPYLNIFLCLVKGSSTFFFFGCLFLSLSKADVFVCKTCSTLRRISACFPVSVRKELEGHNLASYFSSDKVSEEKNSWSFSITGSIINRFLAVWSFYSAGKCVNSSVLMTREVQILPMEKYLYTCRVVWALQRALAVLTHWPCNVTST